MSNHTSNTLDHEKLNVYQSSIQLIVWLENILRTIPPKHAVKDQLDRASTSVALNIAEGNGKYTSKDRCRFFDNARGSALECAAALDILTAKGLLHSEMSLQGKQQIRAIIAMLIGLIKSNSDYRIHEDRGTYSTALD